MAFLRGSAACAGVLLGAAMLSVPPASGAQAVASVRPLEYTKFVLPNGLVALLNEDHSSPIVAVDVWYHIGAKDERPGQVGFAHLCEHLMAEGSPNVSGLQKLFIQALGGSSARWAATTEDVTHYYYTVPRHQLETALWLESDRMAAPLSLADAAHIGAVREVIRQEHTQAIENVVFGAADGFTLAALFPGDHPYRVGALGPLGDLDVATPEDAKGFCRPYYVPSNAVIALSGDLSPAHVKTLIEKYFGDIAVGQAPPRRPIPTGGLDAPKRLVLEDARARAASIRFAWPTVGFADSDRLALVVVASSLSRDRTGVLSKLLVYDRGIATRVAARNFDFERGGLFQIDVFPKPGVSLTVIEQIVDSTLAAYATHPLRAQDLDEIKRANAVDAVTLLQTRTLRADTLAQGEMFAHDPVAYAKQVSRTSSLTAADLQRAAQRYLTARHIVMSMVPGGKLDLVSRPEVPFTNVTPPAAKSP